MQEQKVNLCLSRPIASPNGSYTKCWLRCWRVFGWCDAVLQAGHCDSGAGMFDVSLPLWLSCFVNFTATHAPLRIFPKNSAKLSPCRLGRKCRVSDLKTKNIYPDRQSDTLSPLSPYSHSAACKFHYFQKILNPFSRYHDLSPDDEIHRPTN